MIEIIKEVGIFIVIAQAVLYFVPGEAYAKYVKVIIGIIMIAKMAQPVLSLVSEDGFEELLEQSADFTNVSGFGAEELNGQESKALVLSEIEKELKTRLDENSIEGYAVRKVSVKENQEGEVEGIVIVVDKTNGKEESEIKIDRITVKEQGTQVQDMTKQEEDRLREYYGNLLSVPAGQIEINGL